MHTTVLRSDEFEIRLADRPVTIPELLPGFDEHDRLGIVLRSDHAAAGAAGLILAVVTAFYDRLRAAHDDVFAYPDYFAFSVGRPRGGLRKLDIYPHHKEVVVAAEPKEILRTINDRGVTRLLVPDGPPGATDLHRETRASAERRLRTAIAYSPTGRVHLPDVTVAGGERGESFVTAMLAAEPGRPDSATLICARAIRAGLSDGGRRPVESFRRVDTEQALALLSAAAG